MGKKADIVRRIERDGCLSFDIQCQDCPLDRKTCKNSGSAQSSQQYATEWLAKRAERKAKGKAIQNYFINDSEERAKKIDEQAKPQWDGKVEAGKIYVDEFGQIILCESSNEFADMFSVMKADKEIGEMRRPATAADLIRAGMIEE